jgi:hypothetical protein
MGRRRIASVPLPEGVHKVISKGRAYYYWSPNRGTGREGERIRLPSADENPIAFAREIERLQKAAEPVPANGTVAHLTRKYRESEDFKTLSESTRTSYALHLDRIDAAWGPLSFELSDGVVLALRDHLAGTPGMANQLLSVGRTVWKWGASIGVKSNQFLLVKDLPIPDRGHIPWPAWAVEEVCKNASPDLVRMVRLGMMTCQRESDLIRMGPAHRERQGIWCRPKKTRKKRKAFCIPLAPADAKTLDRWATSAITFTNSRWLAPIARHNPDLYLYSPRAVAYTETSLRARWHRWLETDNGKALCVRWRAWVAEMVKKYEWEVEPDEALYPTIHGLRGTGILLRRAAGHDIDQIANDIGMSRQMVERYMRFRDQMEIAMAGQAKLQLVHDAGG